MKTVIIGPDQTSCDRQALFGWLLRAWQQRKKVIVAKNLLVVGEKEIFTLFFNDFNC